MSNNLILILAHQDDEMFWSKQLEIDLWIQELLSEDSENTLH